MFGVADLMAACTNPKAGRKSVTPVSLYLRRTVSAFLFTIPAAQTTRDVSFTRHKRRRAASADATE
jgi:hypothetical protein